MRFARKSRYLFVMLVPSTMFMVFYAHYYSPYVHKFYQTMEWKNHDNRAAPPIPQIGTGSGASAALGDLSSFVASDVLVADMNSTEHTWPWGNIKGCDKKKYDITNYPDVSVIITFYEVETIYHLLHTVHAVVQNTPAKLLREVILVDDATTKDDLNVVLHNYIQLAFKGKVRVIKSPTNVGLIKARNLGFHAARGQVVAVMDSHMEPRPFWMEAMLEHIVEDRKTIAVSFLDWMEKKKNGTWKYVHGPSTWKTYFDWELTFGFMDVPYPEKKRRENIDGTAPIRTPTMIGGIFAVRRDFLEEIGYYDDGLQGWGGENVEMTMKAWLCGGRVLNVPCSHVAHLEPGNRGYRSGKEWQDKIKKNYKRVSQIFGDHEKYIAFFRPNIKHIDPGDLSVSFNILKKCPRDSHWFFREVFPEIGIFDRNTLGNSGVMNVKEKKCIDTMYSFQPKIIPCEDWDPSHQGFFLTLSGRIRIPVHYLISTAHSEGATITLSNCISAEMDKINTWYHWKNGPLIDKKSGLCLQGNNTDVRLRKCVPKLESQRWKFNAYTADYDKYITNFHTLPKQDLSKLDAETQQYLQTVQTKIAEYETFATTSKPKRKI